MRGLNLVFSIICIGFAIFLVITDGSKFTIILSIISGSLNLFIYGLYEKEKMEIFE